MPQTAAELLESAMQLSQADRDWLAQELSHPPGDGSTEAEREAALSEEIQHRLDEIDSGSVEMIPGEEVMRHLRERIEAYKQIWQSAYTSPLSAPQIPRNPQ